MVDKLLKSLKQVAETVFSRKNTQSLGRFFRSFLEKFNLSPESMVHVRNLSVLVISYTLASLIIYPEFFWWVYIKEIFSLLCIYGATFLWLAEHPPLVGKCSLMIGVTAFFAPVIFMNTTFSVAFFSIIAIVIAEYVIYEYLDGCNLFSSLIPVYIICDNIELAKVIKDELCKKFKILELVLIETNDKHDRSDIKASKLKCDEIESHLKKISKFPFFPFPRRIMYASSNSAKAINYLPRLHSICVRFSIPLLKIFCDSDIKNRATQAPKLRILPATVRDIVDIDCSAYVKHKERGALNAAFKNSRVWVFFDGRSIIVDLIHAISLVSSVDLTIICEPGYLSERLLEELRYRSMSSNFKIKITDVNMLSVQEAKPDIMFYTTPVKSTVQDRYNLKEIFIKNVLNTQTLIKYAQSVRVKHVFVLSGSNAFNAFNWVGVTQRLSELLARQADRKRKTLFTKFKAIRVPECITDPSGMFDKMAYSVLTKGRIEFDFFKNEIPMVCQTQEIFLSLLRLVCAQIKEDDPVFGVYALSPDNPTPFRIDDLAQLVGGMFGLRIGDDVQVSYNTNAPVVDIEECLTIKEEFEKTDIPHVMRMKHSTARDHEDDISWDMEQIRKMKIRELMSIVFHVISDKKN